jgi:putative flippase GtrA
VPSSATRLLRSALVGLAATAADVLTLASLVDGLRIAPQVANVPGLLVGVVVQFVGNKRFAFRDRSPVRLAQVANFTLVETGTLALNAFAFHWLVAVTPVPYVLARLAGSAAVFLAFSYPLWQRVFAASNTTELAVGRPRTTPDARLP